MRLIPKPSLDFTHRSSVGFAGGRSLFSPESPPLVGCTERDELHLPAFLRREDRRRRTSKGPGARRTRVSG